MMRTVVMFFCLAGQLFLWELQLKTLSALHRRTARRYVARRVSWMASRLMAIVRVYGRLKLEIDHNLGRGVPDPALFCSNHQSVADIAVILSALPDHRARFVAKKELSRGFPAVSEVLRIQRHALIDRKGDYRNVVRQLERLGRGIDEGHSPVVFAEGTRSRDGRVLPFHPGGIRTLLAGRATPIVAIAVDGGYRIVGLTDLAKRLNEITYRAKLVGVFKHDGTKRGVQDAVAAAERAVTEQIERWRSEAV